MDICALQLGEQVQKSQTHLHVQLSRWRTTVGAWLVREEGIEFLAWGYQDNICSLPDINLMCLLVQALSWAQGYYNKENRQGSFVRGKKQGRPDAKKARNQSQEDPEVDTVGTLS